MPDTKVSPNSEMDLGTLLKLIPDFDTSQNSQVYRFIRSCDSAFNLASVHQQTVLLTYALNKLTGPGSSDVHSKQFFKWCDLKQFLIQKFSQTKTLAHLNLELQSYFQKPQESITEFFLRVDLCRSKIIEKLTAEIIDSTLEGRKATTEETALNVFVNGLSSDIGMMLRVRSFESLLDAGNFAIQEEKIRNMNKARQVLYNIPSSQIKNQSVQPKAIPQFRNSPKQCNYCKKMGHLISECRKREYNNSFKNQIPQNQRAAVPSAKINNLNSEAAEVLGMPSGTASAHSYNVQTTIPSLETLQIQ